MANAGNSFITKLKDAHLGWGELRYTDSREPIPNEGYIQIPMKDARRLNILNSNGTNHQDILGKNLFKCKSADGNLNCVLRAQGCCSAGEIYAKQFSADNNLKIIGNWYRCMNAQAGNRIKVTWKTPTDIIIELIR